MKPHQELRETIREALCPNWPHPGITGCVYCMHGEGAMNAVNGLLEQQEVLVRVANTAVAYCSDLNNRGEGDTDDLEAAIAALYPATGMSDAELLRRVEKHTEPNPARVRGEPVFIPTSDVGATLRSDSNQESQHD